MKKSNLGKKILAMVLTAFVCLVVAGVVYVNDYYRPSESALATLESDRQVEVFALEDGTLVFKPATENIVKGLIFYPGGKVAYEAYAPLMRALAEQGILCVLPEMPCNLAVLDMNAAEDIPGQFPEITEWYLGGHSLGSYGAQKGDGMPKITEQEQLQKTVDIIMGML